MLHIWNNDKQKSNFLINLILKNHKNWVFQRILSLNRCIQGKQTNIILIIIIFALLFLTSLQYLNKLFKIPKILMHSALEAN